MFTMAAVKLLRVFSPRLFALQYLAPVTKRPFISIRRIACNEGKRLYSLNVAATPTCGGSGFVSVTDNGKKLQLLTEGDPERRYHSVWLRHNCRCPECYSQSAQFSTVHPDALTKDLRIISANTEDDNVYVTFNSGHVGTYNINWLIEHSYSDSDFQKRKREDAEPLVTKTLPVSDYRDVMETEEGLYNWLKQLNYYGVSLLCNTPTEHGTIKEVAKKIGYIQETIYGTLFDVIGKEQPVNLAYGFSDLNFHMDLLYYESPPGIQMLHCVRNDPCIKGGESIMLDAYPVVKEMREKYPRQFDTLTKVPVTFYRVHHSHDNNPCDMKFARPHIVLDKDGQISAINWNPHGHYPLDIPEDQVEDYYEAFTLLSKLFDESEWKIVHRLQPGEAMTFNNRRLLHARNAFVLNGGMRHLQGLYVKIDFLRSKFEVLSKKLGKHEKTKRVFSENMK